MRAHIFLITVATSAVLGLCCERAHATEVTVVSSRGSVSVTQGDHLVPVSASTHLTLPAQIKTGSDGMLDLQDNDSLVHIGPNSTVALPDTGPSGSLVDRYLQSAGSALYNIQSRHGRPMSVQTPYLVSVVKGTVFTVAVEEGATSVTLMEGSLDVSAPGVSQHVLLKPNQSIRHGAGESSLLVSPVGAAPQNIKGSAADVEAPVTDDVHAAQFALVTRDLAEVGATVSAQHSLAIATGAHGSPGAPVAGTGSASGASSTGSSNAPSSGGIPGTGSTSTTSSSTTVPGSNTSVSSNGNSSPSGSSGGAPTGTTTGTSGSPTTASTSTSTSSSGSSSTAGTASSGTNVTAPSTPASSNANSSPSGSSSGTSTGTTSGAAGSPTSGSTATSGSTSSSGSNRGLPALPEIPLPDIGCNGKNNWTGLGQCLGHIKPH